MSDHRMTVPRIPVKGGSSVESPLDRNWDDLTKLQWQAAVTALDTGLDVSIERAGVRRRGPDGWQDVRGLFNVQCGNSSSGPFDYDQADYVLLGISIGARTGRFQGGSSNPEGGSE